MKNCKRCEHKKVCDNYTANLCNSCYWNKDVIKPSNDECPFFKDKNKIIELPCKVGDSVYYYSPTLNDILEHEVKKIDIRCFADAKIITFGTEVFGCFGLSDFGKTVFLTREEAEKVLKEINR